MLFRNTAWKWAEDESSQSGSTAHSIQVHLWPTLVSPHGSGCEGVQSRMEVLIVGHVWSLFLAQRSRCCEFCLDFSTFLPFFFYSLKKSSLKIFSILEYKSLNVFMCVHFLLYIYSHEDERTFSLQNTLWWMTSKWQSENINYVCVLLSDPYLKGTVLPWGENGAEFQDFAAISSVNISICLCII